MPIGQIGTIILRNNTVTNQCLNDLSLPTTLELGAAVRRCPFARGLSCRRLRASPDSIMLKFYRTGVYFACSENVHLLILINF